MANPSESTDLLYSPESPNPREKLEKRFEAHRGQEANPEAAAGEEEFT